ncbi:BF3164 family lipoprotein [Belliella aquatica]|nr:BF3164 family lipoprotein [Belliella aquatica]MCH7404136.1 BF3164 family lipoprotein [Belliella aquatica]
MKFYCPIILLILIGCSKPSKNNSSESHIIFEPNKTVKVQINSIKKDLKELKNPITISGEDGKYIFVIEDNKIPTGECLIHIFNPRNLELVSKKGVVGFGPNEMPNVSLIDLGFNKNTFLAYSSIDKKMSEYNITDNNPFSIEQYKQSENLISLIRMISTSDSTFLGISSDDQNRLVEYNKKGERIAGYGNWEIIDSKYEMDNFLIGSLNAGWFTCDESKRYFVKASISRDRLEIFDYHNKKFTIVDGPETKLPKFEIVGSTNNSRLIFDSQNPYRYRDVSITAKNDEVDPLLTI